MRARELEARIALLALVLWLYVVIDQATSYPWNQGGIYDQNLFAITDLSSGVVVVAGIVWLAQRSTVFRR